MSTAPIQIPITVQDLSTPGFASATRNAQGFKAAMEGSAYSMREAQGAARLFNEELGTHMSRHLTTIIAQSSLLGPALEMALPIAAAVGFYEVISKVAEKLRDMYEDTEGSKRFGERMKAATDSISKFNEQASKETKAAAEVGASAQQKWATALDEATAKVTKQKTELEDLTNKVFHLQQGIPVTPLVGKYNDTAEDLGDVQRKQLIAQAALKAAIADQTKARAELNAAQSAGMAEYNRQMEEAIAKSQTLQKEINKWAMMWDKAREKAGPLLPTPYTGAGDQIPGGPINAPDWMAQWSKAQTQPLYSGSTAGLDLVKIQTDQNAAIQAAQQIYADTATKADVYSQKIQVLTELLNQGRVSQQQFTTAAMQAASELDNNNKAWKKFGDEVERNIANAAFMRESWKKALETILEEVTMLIAKLYVMGPLMKSLGTGGGGGGGFLSSLGGLFGGGGGGGGASESNWNEFLPMVSGGPVSSGMSYLVGEQGPELFSPGRSGSITPNGALGRSSVVYQIDARGADVSVEQRIMRLLPLVEERAVQRSIATVQERNLRR